MLPFLQAADRAVSNSIFSLLNLFLLLLIPFRLLFCSSYFCFLLAWHPSHQALIINHPSPNTLAINWICSQSCPYKKSSWSLFPQFRWPAHLFSKRYFPNEHCPFAQQVSVETEKCGLVAIISMGGHNEWQVSINLTNIFHLTYKTEEIARFQIGTMMKRWWFGLKTSFAANVLDQLEMNWPWLTIFQEVI